MDENDVHHKTEKHKSTTASSPDSSATCHPSKFTFKAYFFLFYSAIGSSVSYLALYFKQLGLTAGHAGTLIGLRLFTEFIGAPLWGTVGDKFRIRKIILFASLVSFSAGTLLLMAVQPQNQKCIEITANKTEVTSLIFTSGGIALGYSHKNTVNSEIGDVLTNMKGVDTGEQFNNSTPPVFIRKVDESEMTRIFIIFLVLIVTCQIIGSVVFTMPEALVVGFLKENVSAFGSFRLWGEVGVAAGSFIVGSVINFYQSEVCGEMVKNYYISFYFFAGFIALAMFTVIFMEVTYPDREISTDINLLSLVKELLQFHNAVYIFVACFLGMLTGLQESFGLWYLDDLGAEPYMLGIASGFRYTIATVGYIISGSVIKKFGQACTIAGCLLLYVAVYMGLSFVLNPWLGVALFSVQGLLYGTSWAACVMFGGTVSLRVGFYAAIQGVLGGCYWGLGVGSGMLVSGFMINKVGVAKTYFINSLMSLVVFVLFSLSNLLVKYREGKDKSDESYKLVPTSSEDTQ